MSTDRVAVVTGGTRGIGRAVVHELAEAGYHVAFTYQSSAEAAEALTREVEALGRQALGVQANMADLEAVRGFYDQVLDRFDTFHAVVSNAGITRDRYLFRMSPEEWQAVIDTNLTGTFHCLRLAVGTLMKQRHGRIVTLSSASGLVGTAGQVNYAATKAGIIGMTKSLAREVAGYGVTVNAVAPGFIETDMTAELPDKVRTEALSTIPAGRFGAPAHVARAVRFLLSDSADYITGQVLAVDGGLTM